MSSPEYHRKQAERADAAVTSARHALEALILARSLWGGDSLDSAIGYAGLTMSDALRDAQHHRDQIADLNRSANTPEVA